MERYLLFDAGCSICTNVAATIERESGGWLTAKSLNDPTARAWREETGQADSWEPALIEVTTERTQAFTGFALRRRLVGGLGPRRAWKVLRLVAEFGMESDSGEGVTRRVILRRGVAVIAAAALGPRLSSAFAAPLPPVVALRGAELTRVIQHLDRDAKVTTLQTFLKAQGFTPSFDQTVSLSASNESMTILPFADSIDDQRGAIIAHVSFADGTQRIEASILSRDRQDAALQTEDFGVQGEDVTAIPGGGFVTCVLVCIGPGCASAGNRCPRFPSQVFLACLAGFCGATVFRCARLCR